MTVQVLTDATFDETIKSSEKPILVDFWAEWCGPCKQIIPILEEIAIEYEDKLSVAKMNIDENFQTPASLSIMSIPAVILFKNGEMVEWITGAKPKAAMMKDIIKHL
jgi:thioredoxin 1